MAKYEKNGEFKYPITTEQEVILLENGWIEVKEKVVEEKPKKKGD